MTLKFNEETKGYDINEGDFNELTQFFEDAEEVLYDPRTGMWEIDGVRFSADWLSQKLVDLSHFINVVAHLQFRKGLIANSNNAMAQKLLDLQNGKIPGVPKL